MTTELCPGIHDTHTQTEKPEGERKREGERERDRVREKTSVGLPPLRDSVTVYDALNVCPFFSCRVQV